MNAARQRIRPVRLQTYNRVIQSTRRFESTTTAASTPQSAPLPPAPVIVTPSGSSQPYRLLTSVILTRSPLLTSESTSFESAYYAYNRRIARALANPFSGELYFKKGAVAERRFAIEDRDREIAAFGDKARVSKRGAEEKVEETEGEDKVKLLDRVSEADMKGDMRSLDRRGKTSLFLLLKTQGKGWRFPQAEVLAREALHEVAARDLIRECGPNMHTWIVGRHPVGVFTREPQTAAGQGDKIFFFKAHIMAGQAISSTKDVEDFAWLTQEEVQERLSQSEKGYWDAVRCVLSP